MNIYSLLDKIKKLDSNEIYIYGYGTYGRNFYNMIKNHGISVNGFVVTQLSSKMDEKDGMPVKKASDYFGRNAIFLIAMNKKSSDEVVKYLMEHGVSREHFIEVGEYISGFGRKRGISAGSYEVVTVAGCPIRCKYCPQEAFTSAYGGGGTKFLTMETFEKSLRFFPDEYDISFGGFSEPFLNPFFMDMLDVAFRYGKRVSLYTTLVGVKQTYISRLLKMPFSDVIIHVADRKGYAKIPVTKEYLDMLRVFVDARKQDGSPFVNMCNAQTHPHEEVLKICDGKYSILTEMTTRAGYLDDKHLISNNIPTGKIKCWNIGDDYLNCMLLPDGRVVLCCMDFGLKHVLGDIHTSTYEELISGMTVEQVKKGMNGDLSVDILCRKCTFARPADE